MHFIVLKYFFFYLEEELTCFKCRAAKSNEECNMQPQQRCDKDTNVSLFIAYIQ